MEVDGQVERNERKLAATAFLGDGHDVLMLAGTGLEGVAAVVVSLVVVVGAGESLGGAESGADGLAVPTLDDRAEALERLAVEVEHLLRVVGGAVGGGLHPELEAAKAEVNIGRAGVVFVAVVLVDEGGAGIAGEADGGENVGIVGLDLRSAEGSRNADVVAVALLVVFDAAAGGQKRGSRCQNEDRIGSLHIVLPLLRALQHTRRRYEWFRELTGTGCTGGPSYGIQDT